MDYVIETDFQGPGFVAVPNHVLDLPGLSPEAIGVLVWFARQARGFIARAAAVQARFDMGKDRWQRIAAELRAVGAIRLVRMRDRHGRLAGGHYVIRWPDAARSPVVLAVPEVGFVHKPGNPAYGPQAGKTGLRKTRQGGPENPADLSGKTRLLTKEEEKDLSARSRKRALSAADRSALRALGPLALQRLRAGVGCIYLEGAAVADTDPQFEALRLALLAQDAENEGLLG